jgi:tRNA (guanine-N7-)-methyltransferase
MTDDGELRLATDAPAYLCWMLERVTRHPAFEWLARRSRDWRERPADWPSTRYEEKARAAGRSPTFLRVRRRRRYPAGYRRPPSGSVEHQS